MVNGATTRLVPALRGCMVDDMTTTTCSVGRAVLSTATYPNVHVLFIQDGDRAIHLAVQNGDQEIVNLLVDYQADINSPNYRRVTPLAVACKLQDWQMVNHLLDKKASCVCTRLASVCVCRMAWAAYGLANHCF